jgi:hypothetical protein
MKLIKLILVISAFSSTIKAQKVGYNHDAHGNRTQRKLVVSSTSNNKMQQKDSTSTFDETTMKLAMEYGVSVFPNPTQSNITITANKISADSNANAILYDNSGKILKTFSNISSTEQVSLANYQAGIYYLSIIVNNQDKLFYKIIKQ